MNSRRRVVAGVFDDAAGVAGWLAHAGGFHADSRRLAGAMKQQADCMIGRYFYLQKGVSTIYSGYIETQVGRSGGYRLVV